MIAPLATNDALMSLAATGVFAAKWTSAIEAEVDRALRRMVPGITAEQLAGRWEAMRSAAGDWEVPEQAWVQLTGGLSLPDSNDRHVLAAAIAGHADCIVTANLRDFPIEIVAPLGIDVTHPDAFLAYQWDMDPLIAATAFKAMRERRKKPEESVEEFARTMERNGLPSLASRLRGAAQLI